MLFSGLICYRNSKFTLSRNKNAALVFNLWYLLTCESKLNKNPIMSVPRSVKFKLLRAFVPVPGVQGEPIEIARTVPAAAHFPNAKGGLREVDSDEIRSLATASSKRLTAALEQV